jgi:tripartite-type tricarboxylate transporter receptor subunit TctC
MLKYQRLVMNVPTSRGTLTARQFAALLSVASCPALCAAQDKPAAYPTKPVRLVVPFAPGASTDILARLLGQKLADALGQQFIVDNRAGAGGGVGAETVAHATPDGYTLMLANPGPMINNVLLRKKPPYTLNDFAPIVYIGSAPLIAVANPKFPPNDVKELVAYAKANPGKVTWGSSGIGSNPHAGLEQLKAATGVNITHVPYKGSAPALMDAVSGQIDALYTTTASAESAIRNARVKVLGVAGPKRSAVIPNVPTLAEQGDQGCGQSAVGRARDDRESAPRHRRQAQRRSESDPADARREAPFR